MFYWNLSLLKDKYLALNEIELSKFSKSSRHESPNDGNRVACQHRHPCSARFQCHLKFKVVKSAQKIKHLFSKITYYLDGVLREHKDLKSRLDPTLQIWSACSIGIRSRNWDTSKLECPLGLFGYLLTRLWWRAETWWVFGGYWERKNVAISDRI